MKKTVSMFVLCVLLMALCVPALANSNGMGASPEDIAVFNTQGSANRGLQDRAVAKLGAEKAEEFMDNKVAHAQLGGYTEVTLPFVVGPDDEDPSDGGEYKDSVSIKIVKWETEGYTYYDLTYTYDARHTGDAGLYTSTDTYTPFYQEKGDIAPGTDVKGERSGNKLSFFTGTLSIPEMTWSKLTS